MRTLVIAGITLGLIVGLTSGIASPAAADGPLDRELRGRLVEQSLDKEGLRNRVYLDSQGNRAVRLASDETSGLSEAVATAGDTVVRSQFSRNQFEQFESTVKDLSTANPSTPILSLYNGQKDEFEILVPQELMSTASVRVSSKAADALGIMIGTFTSRVTSRDADSPPFYGGAKIRKTGGYCSAGIPATISSGEEVMVTAGHCGPVGTAWTTPNGSVGETAKRESGYLQATVGGGEIAVNDESYISGGNYAGSIFVGSGTSSSAKKVTGATNPAIGTSYCMSGATTYWTCSHKLVDYLDVTLSGTTSRFGLLSGSLSDFGDSGGAVAYNSSSTSVTLRGIINGTISYTVSGATVNRTTMTTWGDVSSGLGGLTVIKG